MVGVGGIVDRMLPMCLAAVVTDVSSRSVFCSVCVLKRRGKVPSGDCRESNSGPLLPERRIIPLDHNPKMVFTRVLSQ